jgi:D-aminopeptidase
VKVTVEFRQPESVDRAVRLPGANRLDGLRIEFTVQTMLEAHAGFRAAVKQSYD